MQISLLCYRYDITNVLPQLDDVNCFLEELHLLSCSFDDFLPTCSAFSDVAVECCK